MLKRKENYYTTELAEQLWQVSEAAFEYGSPWSVAQFSADIQNKTSVYWLYELNQQVIGYLVVHLILDEAEVINVAVLPAFKGRKVASALFQAGRSFLKVQQVNSLFLEVREQNVPAIELYKKIGFKEISRRKKYYHQPQEDGLVMVLAIE